MLDRLRYHYGKYVGDDDDDDDNNNFEFDDDDDDVEIEWTSFLNIVITNVIIDSIIIIKDSV
jgi:hypothetical protein